MASGWDRDGARRSLARAGAVVFLLFFTAPGSAQQFALPADLQQRVNKAIDNGVVFLKASQNPLGTWTTDPKGHPLGYAALGGLTLLVCGVPADDPVVQRAARFVRAGSANADMTYELSLSILFLDKLGEVSKEQIGAEDNKGRKRRDEARKDRERIETMALRLIAGQSPSGGWTYRCPVLTKSQQVQLRSALRKKKLTPAKLGDLKDLHVLQEPEKLTPIDPPEKRLVPIWGTTDNSNSQFAMLGIWTARRHGLPVERTLKLIARRYETSQNNYGGWSYYYKYGGGLAERAAMNCVGLLGLAIGNGMAHDAALKNGPPEIKAAGIVGDPGLVLVMVAVDGITKQLEARAAAKKAETDGRVVNGFVALDKSVGQPAGRMENLPMANLYLLWSIERVAVLYNLTLLGNKDWYRWGAEILVANQTPAGNWDGKQLYPGSTPPIDTCLALLFLRRADLASDLSLALAKKSADLAKSITQKLPGAAEKKETPASPAIKAIWPLTKSAPAPSAPLPPVSSPVAKAPPAPQREDPPERDAGSNGVLFVLLGLLMVVLVGGGIAVFFSVRSHEEDGEEEEGRHRPRKTRLGSRSPRSRS